jgi:hypothetical protein
MTTRNNFALLFLMLLISVALGCCAPQESACGELWADCPGVAEDYNISMNASDVKQRVVAGERFFSYYNCSLGYRTPTLIIWAECELVGSDPR